MKNILKLFFLMVFSLQKMMGEDKHFVIVVPSYNNEKWVLKNLDSIFEQEYSHFRITYINDASRDATGEIVQQYIKEHNLEHKFIYIENETNQGALYNLYYAIHSCDDNEVVVLLDGDDWLANSQVLSCLNQAYQDPNIWLTYGQFIRSVNFSVGVCNAFAPDIVSTNSFRKDGWKSDHLRTFYAKLFKLIKKEDLHYEGKFFQVTWDFAIMFPMLEMAQERHKFILDVLYVYNVENPLSDFRIHEAKQYNTGVYIRNKKPYSRIDFLFDK